MTPETVGLCPDPHCTGEFYMPDAKAGDRCPMEHDGEGPELVIYTTGPELNEQERKAMDDLLSVMNTITKDWGMTMNGAELGAAVHVIQGFIVQHMLHRLAPEWSGWGDG